MGFFPFAVFTVFKVKRIIIAVIIFLILGETAYLFESFGDKETTISILMSLLFNIFAYLFLIYCSIAPWMNYKVRERWCKDDADFDDAKCGLTLIILICTPIVISFCWRLLAMLSSKSCHQKLTDIFITHPNILHVIVLIVILFIFITSLIRYLFHPTSSSSSSQPQPKPKDEAGKAAEADGK